MNRLIVVFGVLSLLVWHLAGTEAGCYRKAQDYIQPGFWYTAQTLYEQVYLQNKGLEQVDMYYDNVDDGFLSGGVCNPWTPPYLAPLDGDYWNTYVSPSSALGVAGPLGPYGPLSSLGPAGNNSWNPSQIITGANCQAVCTWVVQQLQVWYKLLHGASNPLAYNGPLGYLGPLTPTQIYSNMYHLGALYGSDCFTQNLDLPGVWGLLGPLGPLGALGLLGPLGPVGATLFSTVNPATNLTDGIYRNRTTGQVVRSVVVPFDALQDTVRIYDLVELYPAKTAQQLGYDNDCSFAIDGQLTDSHTSSSFLFSSSHNHTVSILVLPTTTTPYSASAPASVPAFSDFGVTLELLQADGVTFAPVASSQLVASTSVNSVPLTGYVDFIVFRALPGQRFRVSVVPQTFVPQFPSYRLIVTGTGFLQGSTAASAVDANLFNHLNIYGAYQSTYSSTQ